MRRGLPLFVVLSLCSNVVFEYESLTASPAHAATVSQKCAAIQGKLSRKRSDLLALEKVNAPSDNVAKAMEAVPVRFDENEVEACGKRVAAENEALDDWWDIVLDSLGMLGSSKPGCRDVSTALNKASIALAAVQIRLGQRQMVEYGFPNLPDFAHARSLLKREESKLDMTDYPLEAANAEQDKEYERQYHNNYTRVAAAGPSQCTGIPLGREQSVKAAGPGPSIVQTDAWLIENLPTFYFGMTETETVEQSAGYDVSDCEVHIDLKNNTKVRPTAVAVPPSPLFLVVAKAASQSRHGDPVDWESGLVDLSDAQPGSIKVKTSDEADEVYGFRLDRRALQIPFGEEDKARRAANALTRLAALCGAKDDPF